MKKLILKCLLGNPIPNIEETTNPNIETTDSNNIYETTSTSTNIYQNKKNQVVSILFKALPTLENSINAGRNKKGWVPYNSIEGGASTIGYGFKLNPGEYPEIENILKRRGYITEQENLNFLKNTIHKKYDRTKELYDKQFGKGSFDRLHFKRQALLTDFVYNMGDSFFRKFPKLLNAIYKNNYKEIKNNINSNVGAERLKFRQNLI